MADVPAKPASRKEEYLASIAGMAAEVPSCPRSREEAYLDAIDQRAQDLQNDVDELNDKVTALATDFSYKGSVDTEQALPDDPAVGDVYTIADTGKMQVWDGENWQVLNMSGTDINVVQTTGTSTEDVMSQNAVTSMVYDENYLSDLSGIVIGKGASIGSSRGTAIGPRAEATGSNAIAIQSTNPTYTYRALASGSGSIAIGQSSATAQNAVAIKGTATARGAIALGVGALATQEGQVDIGATDGYEPYWGYNRSVYRLLTGLYDPQSDHDAATKGYVDAAVASAFTNAEFNTIFNTNLEEE